MAMARRLLQPLLLASCCWQFGACFLSGSHQRRPRCEWDSLKSKNLYQRSLRQGDPAMTNSDEEQSTLSRRRLFQSAATVAVLLDTLGTPLLVANAAAPITAIEADNFQAKAQRLLRPKPPKALRPKLNQDFAVLLMRSSYNALDQLDCVAMEQFQRDFFLIRQAEYQQYVIDLGPGIVQQGDLKDPFYFDFISFAQYATINREISQNPGVVFNEQKPVDGGENEPQQFTTVVVKRDPALTNAKLGPTHRQLVASSILNKLDETFGATDARIPKFVANSRPPSDTVLAAISQLTKLFLINGYAWEGSAFISKPNSGNSVEDASGTQFTIALTSPATIWSGQALQVRSRTPGFGGDLINSFLLITAKELVMRMGYSVVSSSVSYDGTKEISSFTLR